MTCDSVDGDRTKPCSAAGADRYSLGNLDDGGNICMYHAEHFEELIKIISELQKQHQSLSTTITVLREVQRTVNDAVGETAQRIKNKFERVLQRNPGLETIVQIEKILRNDGQDSPSFMFAPLAKVDVERSSSRYETLLTDRRHRLTPENEKLHLIPMCNARHGMRIPPDSPFHIM